MRGGGGGEGGEQRGGEEVRLTKLPATLFSAIAMNLEDTPGGRGVYTIMIVNPVVYVSPKRSVAVTCYRTQQTTKKQAMNS